jgi:hypothetical protein
MKMTDDSLLDAGRLRKITDEMITAITSPPFVEAMRKMKSTPEDQRLKVAAQILNPETLRSKGVPLPSGMRITSRYFEPGKSTIEVAEHDEVGRAPVVKEISSKGVQNAGACAGGGAGTICGCAGS